MQKGTLNVQINASKSMICFIMKDNVPLPKADVNAACNNTSKNYSDDYIVLLTTFISVVASIA